MNIRTFLKKMLKEIRGITRRIQKAISKHITNPYKRPTFLAYCTGISRVRIRPLIVLKAPVMGGLLPCLYKR